MVSTPNSAKKKVHFAENVTPTTSENEPTLEHYPHHNHQLGKKTDDTTYSGKFLSVNPAYELLFSYNADKDATAALSLTNTSTSLVAYKVKTTAPVQCRVKPSMGMIPSGSTVEVLVTLLPEIVFTGFSQHTLIHTKFLLMAMELEDEHQTISDIGDLWKDYPKEKLLEHKIRCGISPESLTNEAVLSVNPNALSSLCNKMEVILEQNMALTQEVRNIKATVYTIFAFQVVLVILFALLVHFDLLPFAPVYVMNSCLGPTTM